MDAGSDASTIGAVLTPFLALVGAAIGAAVISGEDLRRRITSKMARSSASKGFKSKVSSRGSSSNQTLFRLAAAFCTLSAFCRMLSLHFARSLVMFSILTLVEDAHITEFGDRISLLLKHDWDRAKREAGEESIFCDPADFKPKPVRMTYEEYKLAQSKTPYRYT
jgi:hypothetical protein